MPTPRSGLAVGVVNGVLYAIGGETSGTQLATVEAYTPATNTWTTKAPMPIAGSCLAAGVVNNIIYVVGLGSVLEAYDPSSNTWTTKAPMPTARSCSAVGVVNGILYVVGGTSGSNLGTVEAYVPSSNTWTTKTPMPLANSHLAVGVLNGVLYAVGGAPSTPATQAYDPITDTWTSKAWMPFGAYGHAAGVINGTVYAVGGDIQPDYSSAVQAYDPENDLWTTKAPMPTARGRLAGGVVNGVLYVVGGFNGNSLSTVEAYQPSPTDEPAFDVAAGDSMVFNDNMDAYTNPHDMDTWRDPSIHPFFPDDYPNNYAVINPGLGSTGKALELVYINGGGERFIWKTDPENNAWYTPADAATVIQYYFRISKNGGPGGGPGYGSTDKGMKWIELWNLNGQDRTQFSVTAGDATTGPLWHVNPASRGTLGYQPVGPYWNQVNNNQWHRATYLYQPASSPGSMDGIARMWIDGTKVVDVSASAAGITPPGGTKVWCTSAEVALLDVAAVGTINLGEYMNGIAGDGVTDLPMALDFDDLKWWKLPTRIQ